MGIKIDPNSDGTWIAKVNEHVVGKNYTSESKACEKVLKWLKGQGR